jgi:hypothetical protein
MAAKAFEAMVTASSQHHPVPQLEGAQRPPTKGWLRCIEAMAGVELMLRQQPRAAAEMVDSNDQVLFSSCSVARLGASRPKQRVDELIARHARQAFPRLPAMLSADPSLVLLLLEAPNLLTATALAKEFPELGTPALAARVCIPQADPLHYSMMVTAPAMNVNVRFQRLGSWLTANSKRGLHVPIFFADYETSVYGRRSMQLSPLQDVQRFLRYGFAGSSCLLGVTLSYRSLHKLHYPPDAPVLTEEDVAGFVEHEAACAGLSCELLECFRYGMVFSLFMLRQVDNQRGDAASRGAAMPTFPPDAAPDAIVGVQPSAPAPTSPEAGASERLMNLSAARPPPASSRPRQARTIHGHGHLTRRWRDLGFVVAAGGVRLALLLTREVLADPEDITSISIIAVNRSEDEIECHQELCDLGKLYPERVRVAFSLTADASEVAPSWRGFTGRGDVAMARAVLPSPTSLTDSSESPGNHTGVGVMILVTGRVQGDDRGGDDFVELWAGLAGKRPSTKGKASMQRVQGSVGGILAELGFSSSEVFKM